jgi:PKD repeat protein
VDEVPLRHGSNIVTIDDQDHLFVTGFTFSAMSRVDTSTATWDWDRTVDFGAFGVAVTEDGNVWVASQNIGTVNRYDPQGVLVRTVPIPGGPTGVAVDRDGKIWTVGELTGTITRIDPVVLTDFLEKDLVGTDSHLATGDLTGIVARTRTSRYGTWTVVYDGVGTRTLWGRISWIGTEPAGTEISVRVRSSDDQETWSAWERAENGVDLSATPHGRYLQIQASLHQLSGQQLPTLSELTVAPDSNLDPPEAGFDWAPTTPRVNQEVQFSDTSSESPTSWAWDFGDGTTSNVQNPTHIYLSSGSFGVSLRVVNGAGSDEITATVVVAPDGCEISCSAAAPMTGHVGEPVTFSADAVTTGCDETLVYAWMFGDGGASAAPDPTHTYQSTGTHRWQMTVSSGSVGCSQAGDLTITGDGPGECSSTYWVPVASHSSGANGSVWRTDLGLLGEGLDEAAVELRLHTSEGVESRVVTVAGNAMVNLVDVVDWIRPGLTGSAALEVCSDGLLVVSSRTYNVLANDHECFAGGTFGQFLAGALPGTGLSAGSTARLSQLRESEGFRTNIGVVNGGDTVAEVEIALFDATGILLTTFTLEIEPGEWLQENRPFLNRAGRRDLDAAWARVSITAGSGVFAYASVIDNVTNDPTTVPMRE